MPPSPRTGRPRLGRIVFFSLAAWALVALGRAPRPAQRELAPQLESSPLAHAPLAAPARRRPTRSPRRLAMSFAVAVLFFAGASLSAVAGDRAVGLLGEEGDATQVEAADAAVPVAVGAEVPAEPEPAPAAPVDVVVEPVPAEPAPAELVPAEPAAAPAPAEPVLEPAPAPAAEANEDLLVPSSEGREAVRARAAAEQAAAPAAEAAAPAPEAPVAADAAEVEPAHAHEHPVAPAAEQAKPARTVRAQRATRAPAAKPVVVAPAPRTTPLDPEASAPGVDATIWVHRTLPDPTPSSLRLSPSYASRLVRTARSAGADWALVLGVLRAETTRPQSPLRPATIADTADRLVELGARRNAWNAALAFTGRTATSDRALALARYYRAIGIDGLVHGLRAEQDRLAARLLADERVTIYDGGRADLAAGRVDVRVVVLIAYLAEAHGQVTVSSLVSGHRLYSRPGVVSAHVYGAAVDIAALAGQPILGHQQLGSVTERAVRDVLLLPAELRPRQVISLIGMGGPSFALANHDDHIHVGF